VLLDDYLAGLLSHLQTSINDEHLGIVLKSQIASVRMPVDQSVSLGVVLNEWVSNAIKYAYPDGKGEIRIELKTKEENNVELTVADQGVGVDRRTEAQGTGFGTKIVRAMAVSLKGEIVYEQGNPGTIVRMIFPLRKLEEEQIHQEGTLERRQQNAS